MNKKNFKSPADEFLSSKPQNIANNEENANANILSNENHNIKSNRKAIVISDIFDNIKEDRNDGATRSFYLSDRTYSILVQKAKAKNISNSKFLEGILNQLFFNE